MSNIFLSELIQSYAPGSSNNGNVVSRNGVAAMSISPSTFYHGSGALSYVLNKEFGAGQYLFDIWIDVDDIYYDGVSDNVPGGVTIHYSESDYVHLVAKGNRANPIGWQHLRFLSDPSKNVVAITFYYYVGTPAYYRYDSIMTPITNSQILKNGICKSGAFTEPLVAERTIMKGGAMKFREFVED